MSELDTQLDIALSLSYITQDKRNDIDQAVESVAAKLAGLVRKVKEKIARRET